MYFRNFSVYAPDEKRHHLECTRLMNEEMYKLLKQKQDNYEALVPITEQSHAEVRKLNENMQ